MIIHSVLCHDHEVDPVARLRSADVQMVLFISRGYLVGGSRSHVVHGERGLLTWPGGLWNC